MAMAEEFFGACQRGDLEAVPLLPKGDCAFGFGFGFGLASVPSCAIRRKRTARSTLMVATGLYKGQKKLTCWIA